MTLLRDCCKLGPALHKYWTILDIKWSVCREAACWV